MAAFTMERFVHSFLYGVADHDALTLAAIASLMLASGGLAACFPARKAARVNPMEALRAE
jgi:ABC-type antimicrobial peptide transport system permease subunit